MKTERQIFAEQKYAELKSYSAVGKLMGISGQSVRQIINPKPIIQSQSQRNESLNSSIKDLSTRTVKYLAQSGLDTPEKIKSFYYEFGVKGIAKLNNMGHKTAKNVEKWVIDNDPLLEIDPFNDLVHNLVSMEYRVGFKRALNHIIDVLSLDDDQSRQLVIDYANFGSYDPSSFDNLSDRTKRALLSKGIDSIGKIKQYILSGKNLLRIDGFGQRSFSEVREILSEEK